MSQTSLIDPDVAVRLLDIPTPASFAGALLETAFSMAGIEELYAYQVLDDGAPTTIASSSGLQDATSRTQLYSRRFHRSDPAVSARLNTTPGSGFVRRVPIQEITLGDYRKLCFEQPKFVEKLCYGWRGERRSLVLSFYSRTVAETPRRALDGLAQVALAGLARLSAPTAPAEGLPDELEKRLASAYPALTPRERAVSSRTLAGWTAKRIAVDLGISQGSVLTYRQRTYQKLGVSRASDLLAAVMR